MTKKIYIIASVAIVVVFDVAFIWFAVPFLSAVCRAIPLAARSSHDLPIAINYMQQWFASGGYYRGPFFMPNLISLDTLLGWLMFIGINSVFIFALVSRKKKGSSNEILSSLPDAVSGNFYGDAFFLRDEAQYRRFADFKIMSLKELEKSDTGLIYLGMINGHICGTDQSEHVLILAPTGVGKTQRMILEIIGTLGFSDESICIFDPKGELFGLCAEFLSNKGFLINRIDFSNPLNGSRWNPLYRAIISYKKVAEIEKEMSAIEDKLGNDPEKHAKFADLSDRYKELIQVAEYEVSQVIGLLYPRPNKGSEGDSSFFMDGCEDSLRMILHFVASWRDIPDEQRNLQTAQMVLQEYENAYPLFPNNPSNNEVFYPLDELIHRLRPDHPAYSAMRALESTKDDKYRSSFLRTAIGVLQRYSSQHALGIMMSGTDCPIDELCDRKTATFIIAPENKKEFQGFAQLYINQMYSLLVDKSDVLGGTLPRRMNMIGEEMGQLPTIEDLSGILSISRGRGIRWVIVLQDFARLNEKYGRDATPTVVNNCAWQVLLETNDSNTAKHFSDAFGSYTTRYTEKSSSQKAYSWFKNSYSDSGRTIERNLLTTSEVMRWKVSYGAFVTKRGQRPAIVPVPMMHEHILNNLMGLGTQAHNIEKIRRVREQRVHSKPLVQPTWRPEYGPKLKLYSANQAKAIKNRWLDNQGVLARQRRGLDGDDRIGRKKTSTKKTNNQTGKSPPRETNVTTDNRSF